MGQLLENELVPLFEAASVDLQGQKLLFAPIREGGEAPALDRFHIRRSDLLGAITNLRNANGPLRQS